MQEHYAEGFIDLEIGDIIEIDGKRGPLHNIRFIQPLRGDTYFECCLEGGEWVSCTTIKVIKRIKTGGRAILRSDYIT